MAEGEAYSSELVREGEDNILRIDFEKAIIFPSIEDSPSCMSITIEKLIQNPGVTKIVFYQKREYEYSYEQTEIIIEIANIYNKLIKQKGVLSYRSFGTDIYKRGISEFYDEIRNIIYNFLKSDPIAAYVELKRILRREKMRLEKAISEDEAKLIKQYTTLLEMIVGELEKTKLITLVKPYLPGYRLWDREIYRKVFSPVIKPDFMFAKLMANYPTEGEDIDSYDVENTDVTIFRLPTIIQPLYHIVPPEFKLTEDKYEILDTARKIIAEHKPRKEEFVDPERIRHVFFNIGHDLIEELANYRGIKLRSREIDELTNILVRYTIGYGLIEVLLQDDKIQDVTINSPLGQSPAFIVHQDYDDCVTNIIPTLSEGESWASKLRMISGRPLDEANPILDTELIIPKARARVAVVTRPLNPTGLAYAFRRHRDEPWTLPLFIKNRMLSPLAAGLISFLIDGSRTMLVAGTRSAGKTSLLGAVITEIMRKYRIITIEDTLELPVAPLRKIGYNIQSLKVASALTRGTTEVAADEGIRATLRMGDSCLIVGEVRSSLRGDQEVMIIKDGLTKRMSIKDIENHNSGSIYLPTVTNDNKAELKQLSGFVKHPKRSRLIKITTNTGRSVIVTPDHSVFTHVNFKLAAINTDQLKRGDPIIIPSKIPEGFNDIDHINLLELFKKEYRLENAEQYIRKAIKAVGWKKASKLCGVRDIYRYLLSTQKTRVPIDSFLKLMQVAKVKYNIEDLRIKKGTASSIPAKFPINENVMRFIGYYLAEGNISKDKIQITNSKPEIIEDIKNICEKEFGLKISQRKIEGYGESVQTFIMSKPLRDLLISLGCGKTSYVKRIPDFVYGLSKRKICSVLRGMYSGDGSISSNKNSGNMIRYFSTSKKLVEDVSYALLSLGIVCRLIERPPGKEGKKNVFIAEIKQRKYVEYFLDNIGFTHKNPQILRKSFPHSKDNSVSFDPEELEKHLRLPRKYRHLRKTKCCSKDYLERVTEDVKCSKEAYDFAHGDFFIDKVKSIDVINLKEPEEVYDLEVKSTQRFIGGFGGILLHNTEARALYEAMRVGALANVVAGTIHGDSPYGVFDRVVNDLGVPRTSFKATDIVVVANPIKSPDGLHKWRRVTQITEIGKYWEEDPLLEKGFRDLLKYDAKTDQLEPTLDLINGESDILKGIAGNVKEWAGNWEAVWKNIQLRAKMKETLLEYSQKSKMPRLLEAEFVIQCNDQFHRICEDVTEEIGFLDPDTIFFRWNEWVKRMIKNMSI